MVPTSHINKIKYPTDVIQIFGSSSDLGCTVIIQEAISAHDYGLSLPNGYLFNIAITYYFDTKD